MKLVIVESPAKAQTINKYLGNNYKVVASIGHVRDLPRKDGAVEPEKDFQMSCDQHLDKKKVINGIIKDLKDAETLKTDRENFITDIGKKTKFYKNI